MQELLIGVDMEKHYVFLLNGRAENIFVFTEQDDELAQRICIENNYDKYIWLNNKKTPNRWSTYDESSDTFTPPSDDYLISIGILEQNEATSI